MDDKTKAFVIHAYKDGASARQIAAQMKGIYGRETIRKELRKAGVGMRGRSAQYKHPDALTYSESQDFAEFLGCLYGDGHVSKNTNPSSGLYDCKLVFSANEEDLVTRACAISQNLFGFKPRVIVKPGYNILKFRRSFAKHVASIGYPVGKKSVLNPHLPNLSNRAMKIAFLRGFLNAEASINQTISVQQSVRQEPPQEIIARLKQRGKLTFLRTQPCYFISWKKSKGLLERHMRSSNILAGVQSLLTELEIPSTIYPVRVYIGKNDIVSIHYELQISPKAIKRAHALGLISCVKKVAKLHTLLRQ